MCWQRHDRFHWSEDAEQRKPPRRHASDDRRGATRADLRVSDADRNKVADLLRDAAGEGRIDLDELEERLEATYAAKTYADLVPITHDLPAHPGDQTPAVARQTMRRVRHRC